MRDILDAVLIPRESKQHDSVLHKWQQQCLCTRVRNVRRNAVARTRAAGTVCACSDGAHAP